MNTSDQHIKVVHSDVEILYVEGEDKWTFTLRGRDRSADSLAKAKEFIDKPLPAEKAKPFEKIPAWFFRYQDQPKKVVVTGIAEGMGYGGGDKVWVNDAGTRSKESAKFNIYPQSPKNDALIGQILAAKKEMEKLQQSIHDSRSQLSPLVLPKDW